MKCWVILIFSILISMNVALGKTDVSSSVMQSNKHKLMSMYRYMESLKTQPLKLSALNVYYTPDVQMIINDQLVSKGFQAFYDHFKLLLSQSRDYQFVFDHNPMIAQGNRIAIKYKLEMNKQGHQKIMYVIAYFTFHKGKISRWDEVVSMMHPRDMHLTLSNSKKH